MDDSPGIQIPVAVSAHHVHLCQRTIDALFGPGYRLHPQHRLSQRRQYAAHETISLVGPRGRIPYVRILGPPRAEDQIEVSRTDAMALGLDAPLRLSGNLTDTPGVLLEAPKGRVMLRKGVVRALRHIHMSPAEAERLGVRDRDLVRVSVEGGGRDVIFCDVLVRVAAGFRLELHLDTDEGNAAGVEPGTRAKLLRP